MTAPRAAIFGCAGPKLGPAEAAFFRDADPWGFILFERNIETPAQVSALCAELREAVGRTAPILIDQEGGRVARLKPPHWRAWPAPLRLAESTVLSEYERCEALHLVNAAIATELRASGIDVSCAPLLDVLTVATHDVIGDRAYGRIAADVARRGRAVFDGLLAGGALPIIKHIPGHGRATLDSHEALPVVEADLETLRETDFAAFQPFADAPMGMTAHIVYSAIDAEMPATLSPECIRVIRQEIGFGGLLMTDDLSMKALEGDFDARASRSLAAGCDIVLHCNGDMAEMTAVAAGASVLGGDSLARAERALAMRPGPVPPFDALRLADLLIRAEGALA